ncbi:MAG: hypothetical protein AAB819_02135 [Patescibacteria group bacterium]
MNTKNTTLTIKLPRDLRDGAKTTAKKMGIPLTTVITALLRRFALDEEITLSAKRPNTETRRAIAELRDPVYLAKAKRYKTASELLADVLR